MQKDRPRTHKDLDVWNTAMELAGDVYSITRQFPKEELYGLTLQARRSAVSIPSNIAEGAARKSRKEFIQFLYIALGSVAELETQLLLAARLGFASHSHAFDRVDQVRKMLVGLLRALKETSQTRHESRVTHHA